jgi:hypothetical protein
MSITKKSLAMAVAGAVALGSVAVSVPSPAIAAPVSSNTIALKEAVPDDVIQVHRRYRGSRDAAVFAALALGALSAYIAHKEYKRYRKRHKYYHYGYYGRPDCIGYHGRLYCR